METFSFDHNPSKTPDYTKQEHLRAKGNLSYLGFIALVKKLWEGGHPDIPIVPQQGKNYAQYPCIVFALEDRQTDTNEPKFKHREEIIEEDGTAYIIHGQRFVNIVSFTVITKNDPNSANAIIETFEDFIIEYTYLIKKFGAADFRYARRLSDRETKKFTKSLRPLVHHS